MLEDLLPVWVNILLVIIATTIIWVFLISGLFAKSANEVIRAINRCINIGRYTAPVGEDKVSTHLHGIDITRAVKPVPGPTIRGNRASLQKLALCILAASIMVIIMTILAHPGARKNVPTYFILSLLAYLFDVLFIVWVVVPYKHIGDVEVIYEASDVSKMGAIAAYSLPPTDNWNGLPVPPTAQDVLNSGVIPIEL